MPLITNTDAALLPFFSAANGGRSVFIVAFDQTEDGAPLRPEAQPWSLRERLRLHRGVGILSLDVIKIGQPVG